MLFPIFKYNSHNYSCGIQKNINKQNWVGNFNNFRNMTSLDNQNNVVETFE